MINILTNFTYYGKENHRLFAVALLIFAAYLYFRTTSNFSLKNYLIAINLSTASWLTGGFILGLLTVYISYRLEVKGKQSNN